MQKDKIKRWVDANVWDGEDRSGCKGDRAGFNPDDLQEFCEELVEAVVEPIKVKLLVWEPRTRKGLQRSRITASNSMIDIYIEHGPSSSDLIVLSVHCQSRVYPNLNKAREAAQEHYEKLILGCLE